MMPADVRIRRSNRKIYHLLAVTLLLTALGSLTREVRADSQTPVHPQSASSSLDPAEPLVIQGRITRIEGALVTVKTPDGYPGGPGVHAQFVKAGPTFRVDVSRARILLPDGRQPDKQPLAIGDQVLVVLNAPKSGSPAPGSPGSVNQIYFASIIERIAQGDKIVTH
jgi:hypothetical protein